MSTNFSGICYAAFPQGYNPSIANTTFIFFGSDIAYDAMAPVWGSQYTSKSGDSCNLNGPNKARNDIQTLADMGVKLIRLYDWDPRNNHLNFLNYCDSLGIKVLVPVSNYFVKPDEGLPNRDTLIPNLINSFSNSTKTDYHNAIAGIIIGNEPGLNGITAQNCIDFTTSWVDIEASTFPSYKELLVGHPVDFSLYGGQYPCFGFWDPLLESLNTITTRNLNERLFLAPQSYNDENYLFVNANGSGKGYVDLAYDKYQKPILFTEIGANRLETNYQTVIQGQLSGSITYAANNPDKLIGICLFQFADKVWMPGTSEGSFGTHTQNSTIICTMNYDPADFTHWEGSNVPMTVNSLTPSPINSILVQYYKNS